MATKRKIESQAQLENWDNFCQYHAIGDWYGIWTRYSPGGEVIESFKCIRSLHKNVDCSEIKHENYYIHTNRQSSTEVYGPYIKPITRALYLNNSFSWGFTKIKLGSPAFFETGFRYEDKRVSAVVIYDWLGDLQEIVVITEHLLNFNENYFLLDADAYKNKWVGELTRMTTDWIVSPLVETTWINLENLFKDYVTLRFSNNVAINCPQKIDAKLNISLTVEWLINLQLLQRGIRYYNTSELTNFTLETFTKPHE